MAPRRTNEPRPRPSPITVPSGGSSFTAINDPQRTGDTTTGSLGLGGLQIQSPLGLTAAFHYGHILQPSSDVHKITEAAIPRPLLQLSPSLNSDFGTETYIERGPPTSVWGGDVPYAHARDPANSPFAFFTDFPAEIRNKIYAYLIDETIVAVNGNAKATVHVYKRRLRPTGPPPPYLTLQYHRSVRSHTNFLCTSKQFLFEIRSVLWRTMGVHFQRRWDFLSASIQKSFDVNTRFDVSAPLVNQAIFPQGTDVFKSIQQLTLNLSSVTDFDLRVNSCEVKRLTIQILRILSTDMVGLNYLGFEVDDKSRISSSIIVFLPDPWFLDALLTIKHVKRVSFLSGKNWRSGHATNKKNARSCISALNYALGTHFATTRPEVRLDCDNVCGRQLQVRLARVMLNYFTACPHFSNAMDALRLKIVMLEAAED